MFDLVFGPKFDKAFPKKYLLSKTCGDGFWESTGKDKYEHPGVDIVDPRWDKALTKLVRTL